MTDRELLEELSRDLTNRWMRAEQDGYGPQRDPEKQQAAALARLIESVERMFSAEKRWDSDRFSESSGVRTAAALELEDARAALRNVVAK